MAGEPPTGGSSSGPATDRGNNPVVDPTENVKDILKAAIERQDDLRKAEAERQKEARLADITRIESEREIAASNRDVITERINGIDRATIILSQRVDKVPDNIRENVTNLRELSEEKFQSIQTQFKERDTRQERESRDNKVAVDAAFAAQKEAAAAQDKAGREQNAAATQASREAIAKSEASTAETIKTNQELSKSTTDSLAKGLDEVKTRLTVLESEKRGTVDTTASEAQSRAFEGQRAATARAQTMAIIFAIISIASIVIGAVISLKP